MWCVDYDMYKSGCRFAETTFYLGERAVYIDLVFNTGERMYRVDFLFNFWIFVFLYLCSIKH